MLKIKLIAALGFAAFAACVFLFSNNKTGAQSSEKAQKRDEILQKIAGYKTWQRVIKPESNPQEAQKNEPMIILDSTAMG